jgi:hypothetical protein
MMKRSKNQSKKEHEKRGKEIERQKMKELIRNIPVLIIMSIVQD